MPERTIELNYDEQAFFKALRDAIDSVANTLGLSVDSMEVYKGIVDPLYPISYIMETRLVPTQYRKENHEHQS